jgi:hypothetical protein
MVKAAAQKAVRVAPLTFARDLEGAHPLVKATQRYCERLPKLVEQFKRKGLHAWSTTKPEDRPPHEERGRYLLLRRGLLDIAASLDCMDWVLRFHATVFKGLTDGGMSIAFLEAQPPDRRGGPEHGPAVEAKFKGETFTIKFSQGYRRVQLDAAEVAKLREERSWAKDYEFGPSEKLTMRSAFELVPLQVELRKQQQASAERAQQAAELRAKAERRANAKAEQLKQAFLMAEADARVRQLKDFLGRLETEISGMVAPYPERAAVWVQVVREQLAAKDPVEDMLARCLSTPSWGTWPPDWWPQEPGTA